MFDLNRAFDQWRQRLERTEALGPAERLELEDHLRNAMAEYRVKGLTEEESFWLADRQLGPPAALAAEFAKADPSFLWGGRVQWMLLGYLGFGLLFAAARALAHGLATLELASGLRGAWIDAGYGMANLILLWLALVGIKRLARRGAPPVWERCREWLSATRIPATWAVTATLLGVIVILNIGRSLTGMTWARVLSPADYGALALRTTIYELALGLLTPLLLLRLFFWTRRQNRSAVA